jgi:4-amino-4-deoxy-L-arabinose transferase-like glycosyltransferase
MDTQMIFVILLALWVALRAAREQSLWMLLLSFALVGIGFNIKMIQAYVVLPALLVVYLFGTSLPPRQKMVHLILALLVLAAVSLSWALAVDAIPADQRPYIGTSGDNSVMGLILGHNGEEAFVIEERVWAEDGIGDPGLFRFFNYNMYFQFAWLLPFALIGILAWGRRPENLSLAGIRDTGLFSEKGITLMALCIWLLPALLYFSFTHGNWNLYYLATIVPPLAGLVGIGAVAMFNEYLGNRATGWLLVAALIVTSTPQIWIFRGRWIYNPEEYGIFLILLILGSVLGAIILTWLRLKKTQHATSRNPKATIICIAIAALMIAPAVWSAGVSTIRVQSSMDSLDHNFPEFLVSHAGNTTFLATVSDIEIASSLIITTGKPVMALGGFFGTDQILSVTQMPGLIRNNTVRYVLVLPSDNPQNYRIARDPGVNAGIYSWIEDHCSVVPSPEWSGNSWFLSQYTLYDCASVAGIP